MKMLGAWYGPVGTRFSLILGTRFSIIGTRIGSLKHLKKNCYGGLSQARKLS